MFKSPAIKIDEHGIDMIKNFNVIGHIDYFQIKYITIKNNFLHKRWLLMLLLGLVVAISAFILGRVQYEALDINLSQITNQAKAGFIILPFIFSLAGLILAIVSLRRCQVMIVQTEGGPFRFDLLNFQRKNELQPLIDFLEARAKVIT